MVRQLLAGDRKPSQRSIRPPRAIGGQVGEVHAVTLSQDVRIVSESHGRGISRDRIEGAEHCESRPVKSVDGFGIVERRVSELRLRVALFISLPESASDPSMDATAAGLRRRSALTMMLFIRQSHKDCRNKQKSRTFHR